MPELPEIEALIRRIRSELTDTRIRGVQVTRPRSVAPQSPAAMEATIGKKIASLERLGKNLLLHLAPAKEVLAIRIHLGMTGDLFVQQAPSELPKGTRVVFELTGKRLFVFEDVRGLGRVNALDQAGLTKLRKRIGVDPLSRAFIFELLATAAGRSRKPAKLFLMGQDRIAGIGNMYTAEALWRARIDPRKPINSVSKQKLKALHEAIPAVLREALKGALRTYEKPGSHDSMNFAVYGRKGERCPRCGAAIQRIEQAGRSTYYCPRCQQ